jgi:hypothetical protein
MRWWQLKSRDAALERELLSDLEMEEEELQEHGLSLEEARYAARRAFGNATLIREQTREELSFVGALALSVCRPAKVSIVAEPTRRSAGCSRHRQRRIPLHPRRGRPPHFAAGTASSASSFSLASEFSGFFSSAFL